MASYYSFCLFVGFFLFFFLRGGGGGAFISLPMSLRFICILPLLFATDVP